jgi:transposase
LFLCGADCAGDRDNVGRDTALAFAATIDEPGRNTKSRSVVAYLGLTSRRFQSGEMNYSGRIACA